jgi:hypothetical protein
VTDDPPLLANGIEVRVRVMVDYETVFIVGGFEGFIGRSDAITYM